MEHAERHRARPDHRRRGRSTAWKLAIALSCVALIAAACGDDDDDDQAATNTTVATSAASSTTAATTAESGPAEDTVPAASGSDDPTTFGDAPWPCGPGDASGATDTGVSDTTINIGTGDDRGFTGAPGLDHEMGQAVEAA